jgi:hypothetical protein
VYARYDFLTLGMEQGDQYASDRGPKIKDLRMRHGFCCISYRVAVDTTLNLWNVNVSPSPFIEFY